jgi:beta-phosphoglucomutase
VPLPPISDEVRSVIEQWAGSEDPAVIFDFNGTLSDDEPILYRIFGELFATHLGWTMTAQEYQRDLLGHSDREIIEKAVARHGPGADVEHLLQLRKQRYRDVVVDDNPIRPDTVELVRLLAANDVPMAIVTGAQRDDVMAVLVNSPVGDFIDIVVAEEDVRRGKPDPEGFLAGAALMNRRPGGTLVFEDSVPGVRGALAAGMRCIAVGAQPGAELLAATPAVVERLSTALVSDVFGAAGDGLGQSTTLT